MASASTSLHSLLALSAVAMLTAMNPTGLISIVTPEEFDSEDTQVCLLQTDISMHFAFQSRAQVSQRRPHGINATSNAMVIKKNASNTVVVKPAERGYDISAVPANRSVDIVALPTNMIASTIDNSVLQAKDILAKDMVDTGKKNVLANVTEDAPADADMIRLRVAFASLQTSNPHQNMSWWDVIWLILVIIILVGICYYIYYRLHHERRSENIGGRFRRYGENIGEKFHEWEADAVQGAKHLRGDVSRFGENVGERIHEWEDEAVEGAQNFRRGCSSTLHDDGPGRPCC